MNPENNQLISLEEGDVFYTRYNNRYHLYKLLKKDEAEGAFHVLSYKPIDELPSAYDLAGLEVNIYHLPMHPESFVGAELLAHGSVSDDELIGYYEYLSAMEEDFEEAANRATEFYQEAYLLTDQGQLEAAIENYSKAIELVPRFFEAIDNRAFCKMDLGRWREAIDDFELSLAVNPGSLLAEFSIGECYFRLGDFENAKGRFERCLAIDPTHQVSKDLLLKTTEIIASRG